MPTGHGGCYLLPDGGLAGMAKANAVTQAVEKVGGVVQAAAIMRVQPATVYRWLREGSVYQLVPALRLAKATSMPVERFAPPDALAGLS